MDLSRLRRRVALLKRKGILDPSHVRVHNATTRRELRLAHELVQEAYIRRGYAESQRTFDGLPGTLTLVAKLSKMMGVLTIIPDSQQLGLPSDGSFGRELTKLRVLGHKICEPGFPGWMPRPWYNGMLFKPVNRVFS